MKKLILLLLFAFVVLYACNNGESGDKSADRQNGYSSTPGNKVDSLLEDISQAHDFGMSKMGRLRGLEKSVSHYLDSVNGITSPASEHTKAHIQSMIGAREDLKKADSMMNAWMEGFKPDSAENNTELRIHYLESEKEKVSKMKEQLSAALARADSLLQSNH